VSTAHPGLVEAGMRLRGAEREAWDAFVQSVDDEANKVMQRLLQANEVDLLSLQGKAQAWRAFHTMLKDIDKHHEVQRKK
jgi:hypothetical protein